MHVEQHDVGRGSRDAARPPRRRSPASPTTSTQPVELGAHAGAEERWSSTITTRGAAHARALQHAARPRCPRRARAWIARAAAVALHAPDDRLAHAAAVGRARAPGRSPGRGRGRTPPARSSLDLGVDATGAAAAELGRVDHRLARGGDAAPRRARRASASPTATTSTGTPCVVLDLGRGGLERGGQPRRLPGAAAPAGEPRAQLALLAAGERGHLARVVGAPLHQRERLQHRVVQVRGHLGALLRADALGALGGQRAHQAHDPGREDHAEHDRDDERGEQHVARGAQRAGGLQEREAARRRRAPRRARCARRRRRAPARRRRGPRLRSARRRRRAPAPRGRAAPSDWRQISAPPAATQHERPDDRVGEPQPERAERRAAPRAAASPAPSATSSAPRPVAQPRARRARPLPSAGMSAQASR